MTGILTAGGGTGVCNMLAGAFPRARCRRRGRSVGDNAGQKLIIVESGAQTVADRLWVVKKGSALRFITDLAGKRIAQAAPSAPP